MELTVVKIVENRGLWCVKWQRWVMTRTIHDQALFNAAET